MKQQEQVDAYRRTCLAEGRPVSREVIEDITFEDMYDQYGID